MRPRKNCVLLVGHFTPPVHGMAMAMDALADLISTRGTVIRIRTVPGPSTSRQLHHLRRLPVVVSALAKILISRRKSRSAFLSVDAGLGMVYTVLLTLAARCVRYSVTLQHHSYAYISQRSRLMSCLVFVAGRSTVHMFTCDKMRDDFCREYTRVAASDVVSVAYALSVPLFLERRTTVAKRRLTLGHMGNLTTTKGLADVLGITQEATRRGLVDKLLLAGPLVNREAHEVLKRSQSIAAVEYRGYVSGRRKEEFFGDIDVFLFPSRYKNESFALVVWEAMLRGVPVIAYRAGCLTQASVGNGSVVLDVEGENTERRVVGQLATWSENPDQLLRAGDESVKAATGERERAISSAVAMAARLFGLRS